MTEYTGIRTWDVAGVTSFHRMFYYNLALESLDLTGWNTASATDFSYMFYRAYSLTDLAGYENWDVRNASSFRYMFEQLQQETIDLSNWHTTDALTDLYGMFSGAKTTQILGLADLDVTNVVNAENFLSKCSYQFTTEAYDPLLIAWSQEMVEPAVSPVYFDAGTVQFTPFGEAEAARENLLAHNWVIRDGGSEVGVDPFPSDSITSPVRFSGWTRADMAAFTLATDGGAYNPVTPWGDTLWYTDVPLNPDAPVAVEVKYGDTVVRSASVAWTPTLVDDESEQSVTIRKGHSLLLGSVVQEGAVLELDTDGDGVYDLSGAPADLFPVAYDEYGTYLVTACIDGVATGSLTVRVPQIHFPQNVACEIGYTRELTVGVPEDATDIAFAALNGNDLTVRLAADAALPGTIKLYLTPKAAGTPTLVALDAATGTVLETQIVDEFDLASQADRNIGVVEQFEDGSLLLRTNLTLLPKVADLEVRLHIFKAGVTFDDSTLEKILNTSEFVWNEPQGTNLYPYSLIVPEDFAGGPCHTIKVYQDGVQIGQ